MLSLKDIPVLTLLDDLGAELDAEHQKVLYDILMEAPGQVIMTNIIPISWMVQDAHIREYHLSSH